MVGKIVFGVISHLQVFTPETGHILNDDRADISHFDIIEQFLKARSVEIRAGVAVIHIELGVTHVVFLCIRLEHFLLVGNGVTLPVRIVVSAETAIQSGNSG